MGPTERTADGDAQRSTDEPLPPPRSAPAEEKPPIGATEVVEVRGTSGAKRVIARSDTGAARASIDASLAADIEAGPITDVTRVRSASSTASRVRPVVDLVINVSDVPHLVTASVEDRNHMKYPLLLGRDVLGHYQVDVCRLADEG